MNLCFGRFELHSCNESGFENHHKNDLARKIVSVQYSIFYTRFDLLSRVDTKSSEQVVFFFCRPRAWRARSWAFERSSRWLPSSRTCPTPSRTRTTSPACWRAATWRPRPRSWSETSRWALPRQLSTTFSSGCASLRGCNSSRPFPAPRPSSLRRFTDTPSPCFSNVSWVPSRKR